MNKLLKTISTIVFVFISTFLFAQKNASQIQYISLPEVFSNNKQGYEFSSIGVWDIGRYVILTPALKNLEDKCCSGIPPYVYGISFSAINKAIADSNEKIKDYIKIEIDTNSYKYITGLPGYDGIEGTAIIDNNIYFSIESKTARCYIVKGTISKKEEDFFITTFKTRSLKKPAPRITDSRPENDGFEGITYLPDQNKLLAVFEKDYGQQNVQAYLIDTALKEEPIPYTGFPSVNNIEKDNRRMPDITRVNDDTLICLSTRKSKDLDLIIIDKEKKQSCIETHISSYKANWEGIAPYSFKNKKGVLLISDNCDCPDNDIDETRFAFYSF